MTHRHALKGHAFALAAGLAALVAPAPAAALIILETATLGPTGQTEGVVVSPGQFIATRFTVAERVEVTSIAAHLGARSIGASAFGAIVASPAAPGLPGFAPAAIETEALLSVTFALAPSAAMVSAATSGILDPGIYAVVFGSGYFGTSGPGFGSVRGTNFASTSNFYALVGSGTWTDGGYSGTRIVIGGELAPLPPPPPPPSPDPGTGGSDPKPAPGSEGEISAVPAPPAALLLASALAGFVGLRRRRGRAAG